MGAPRWGPPGIARQKRQFEENRKKRKSHCLEKFGMPEERHATVQKMTADIEVMKIIV